MAPIRNKQLILFDLDGTLVDSVPDLALAVDGMLVQLGKTPAGEEKVRCWVGNGARSLVLRALADDITGDEPGRLKETEFEQASPLFLAAYQAATAAARSSLYPDVLETLSELRLRRMKLACITNKPARFTEPMLEQLGLSSFFDVVLSGDSLTNKKPHPEPLLHVAEHYEMDVANTLMVGDSSNDVKAARAAGMDVACVRYGYNHGQSIEDSEPDWVIDSFTELL